VVRPPSCRLRGGQIGSGMEAVEAAVGGSRDTLKVRLNSTTPWFALGSRRDCSSCGVTSYGTYWAEHLAQGGGQPRLMHQVRMCSPIIPALVWYAHGVL